MTDSERFNLAMSVIVGNASYDVRNGLRAAYKAGALHMQDKIIDRLGDYEANKCAQIAAGIVVETEPD